jgi:hypothetical protein
MAIDVVYAWPNTVVVLQTPIKSNSIKALYRSELRAQSALISDAGVIDLEESHGRRL